MTWDRWVSDGVIALLSLAVAFGTLARLPREVLVVWWMRACGWERDLAAIKGGDAPPVAPGRDEARPGP